METNELTIMGTRYTISGDMLNGGTYVDNKFIQRIVKETISRKIKWIDAEKGLLVCECDRRFIINENLSVTK
jgi:hypothetical protein